MIRFKKTLVLSAFFAATIAMAATDGITLRRNLTTGTETYHMVSNVKQTISLPGGAGDQDFGIATTSSYSFKIGAVDAAGASAPVELTTKIEKVDVDGPMAEMINGQKDAMMKAVDSKGTLDSRNRFVADPNAKVNPMAIMNGSSNNTLAGLFIEFPEKAISVGDTWEVSVPKSPLTGKTDQKLTAKLIGEKEVDGKNVYVVSLSGTVKTDVNLAELMKNNPGADTGPLGQMEMTIKGVIDIKSEANIDKANGKTLSMTSTLSTKQTTEVAGQTIEASGKSTVKMTLDK